MPTLSAALAALTGTTTIGGDVTVSGKLSSDIYYGHLYTNTGITKATSVAGTYYVLTGLTTDGFNNVTLTDSTLTVAADGAGVYDVSYSVNGITHDINNTTIHVSAFVDGVESVIEGERKIGTGGDLGSFSASGQLTLSNSSVVDFRVKADNIGTVSIGHANFSITRIN